MLRILGLNAANYLDHNGPVGTPPGPWSERLPMIVQTIVDAAPDVICLSEIEFDSLRIAEYGLSDMAEQIMALLQQQSSDYESAQMATNIGATYTPSIRWEGLTTISRWTMTSGYIFHSEGDGGNTRISQWAQVSTPDDGLIGVYNTHFSLDADSRLSNANELVALIQSQSLEACCVVGDLNSTPGDPALSVLADAGLADAWTYLHPLDDPGYTFQSWSPYERIDYCWVNGGIVLQDMSLIGTSPSPDGTYLSDHCGTVTAFERAPTGSEVT